MIRRRVGWAVPAWVAGLVLAAAADVAHAEGSASPPPPVEYTLSNGLRVILEEDHRQPLVAFRMSYAAGAAQEPRGRPQLARLVQSLTARHLSTLPTRPLALMQHAGASDFTSSTGFDETYYSATVTCGALELALWSERNRLNSVSHFSDFQLRVEQRVLALHTHETDPPAIATIPSGLIAAVTGQQSLAASPMDATLDDAREFFAASYRPDNAELVLVGDFQIATARELVNRYFGPAKNPNVPRVSREARRAVPIGKHLRLPSDDAASWVALTWPARASTLREHAKQELLLGLLRQAIERVAPRDQEVDVPPPLNVQLSSVGDHNLLAVRLSQGVSPAMLRRKLEDEFARLARGVAPDELTRARQRVLIRRLASWEQLSQRATFLASIFRVTQRPIAAKEYVSELEAVNESDIAALATVFEPKQLTEVDWLPRGTESANLP